MPHALKLSPQPRLSELEQAYSKGLLRKEALEHGAYYRGVCKFGTVARWHASQKRFFYYRQVRGARVLDELAHPADGRTHDFFLPLERVEPGPDHHVLDADFGA